MPHLPSPDVIKSPSPKGRRGCLRGTTLFPDRLPVRGSPDRLHSFNGLSRPGLLLCSARQLKVDFQPAPLPVSSLHRLSAKGVTAYFYLSSPKIIVSYYTLPPVKCQFKPVSQNRFQLKLGKI